MNINDEIESLYDKCNTAEELRSEVARIMKSHGYPPEKFLKATMRGLFGGTTVYLRQDGQYENKWRRKFQPPIPPEEFRNAQAAKELHPA